MVDRCAGQESRFNSLGLKDTNQPAESENNNHKVDDVICVYVGELALRGSSDFDDRWSLTPALFPSCDLILENLCLV